jgi:phosphoserine phosphatase
MIKVFDFDNTIYRGESSIDFALYMLRYNKRILLFLPDLLFNLVTYKLCLVSKEKLERRINDAIKIIVRDREELMRLTRSFWQENYYKLDDRMLRRIDKNDFIITAGPSFLIDAIKNSLNTSNLICSEIDWDRMEISHFNFGDNKVKRYSELCGDKPIDCFYTDSFNDRSMMAISKRVYYVKNGNIKCIK